MNIFSSGLTPLKPPVMNRLRALIRSVFGFSRTETNGFLILLPLMALVIFSEPLYRWFTFRHEEDFGATRHRLDSLVATWEFDKPKDSIPATPGEKELFLFNPNTASAEELERLGFPKNIALRIQNYRAKGGKFLVKSDLAKIYGIDSGLYRQVLPFINLPESQPPARQTSSAEKILRGEKKLFDLNVADTTQLKSIYGIGPVLSRRIVAYRERLGGFASFTQLQEVRGLDSTVVARITERAFIHPDFRCTQIRINQADEKTLAAHPYIRPKGARAIVTYRFQHGNFKSIDDLKKIEVLKATDLGKLGPYVNFEE